MAIRAKLNQKPLRGLGFSMVALLLFAATVLWVADARSFERYQEGCNAATCHGDFTSDVSPKNSMFPQNSKHEMHRASAEMSTDCNLCHTSGDQRNPFIGSSQEDGNGDPGGPGCTGCHNAAGLRRHHAANNQAFCFDCHTNTQPPAEDSTPPYYTSSLTRATNACNPVMAARTNENWTLDDFVGLDNDGDNFYDTLDSDCATPLGSGDVPSLGVALASGGDLTLTWGASCQLGDDDYGIYEGNIGGTFSDHQFVVCTTGGATTATITPSGDNKYYLVVPTNGTVEGSYGVDSLGVERGQGSTTCTTQTIASCP